MSAICRVDNEDCHHDRALLTSCGCLLNVSHKETQRFVAHQRSDEVILPVAQRRAWCCKHAGVVARVTGFQLHVLAASWHSLNTCECSLAARVNLSSEELNHGTPASPIPMPHRIASKLAKLFKHDKYDSDFYAPLDTSTPTIRLLRLLPGRLEDDVHVELKPCSMASARDRYITLSYTWGDADIVASRLIRCNGKLTSISENLFTALRTLRLRDRPLLLWADALCINQSDTSERTLQVGLMAEIYRNSKETVIWLGEPAANEDVGTNVLRSYASYAPFSQTTWTGDSRDEELRKAYLVDLNWSTATGRFGIPDADSGPDIFGAFCLIQDFAENSSYPVLKILDREKANALHRHGVTSDWSGLVLSNAHVRGSRSSKVWEGLARLMSRPWWQRVWIVQETVLSRKAILRYGELSAPWSMFAKAATNYAQQRHIQCLDLAGTLQGQDILNQFSDFVLRIEDIRLQYHARSDTGTILQLLWRYRPLEATEKRDKVFALLGLTTNWQGLPPLLPDYTSDPPMVFTNTTLSNIQRAGSLAVLAGDLEAVLNRKRLANIPSWVMDWSLPCLPVEIERVNSLHMYKASEDRKGTVRFHAKTQLLDVEAVYIDRVVAVGEVSRHTQISDTCAVIRSWNLLTKSREQSERMYPSGGTYEDAFWRTLVGDLIRTNTAPGTHRGQESYRRATPEDYEASRAWSMWSRCISRDTLSRAAAFSQRDLNEGISGIHYALKTATTSRRFFLTSSGYMGLGPKTTAEGDQVYVFKGSNVPFVVRRDRSVTIGDDDWTTLVSGDENGSKGLPRSTASRAFESFQMVGDCFVYGAMDGEVLEQPSAQFQNLLLA